MTVAALQWRTTDDPARNLADLADVYADASHDLWDGLDDAVLTARALNDRRADVDAALLASIGFANTGGDAFERAGPYFVRVAEDLGPTAKLLDDYRGMIFCTIRNYHDVAPEIQRTLGGDNGFSLRSAGAPTVSRPPGRPSRFAGFSDIARHSCGKDNPP